MYTKTNMIATLERARKLLAAGYVRGKWICHDSVSCELQCCAEGAIALAVKPNQKEANHFTGGKYGRVLLDMVDSTVRNNSTYHTSIMSVNDSSDLKTTDSYFVKTIKSLKEQVKNG